MRRFTPASLSRARARSSAGSAAGSCEWNTASAAARRVAASGANRRRLPSAASIAPRTALFTRTGLSPLAMTSAAGLPVAASTNEPSSALMNSALSACARTGGSPATPTGSRPPADRRTPPACSTPWRIVSKLGDASAANASSADCARPVAGASASTAISNRPGKTLHRHAFRKRLGVARGGNRPPPWDGRLRPSGLLAAACSALAGLHVERAARQRRAPVADQVLGVLDVRRPFLRHDEARASARRC